MRRKKANTWDLVETITQGWYAFSRVSNSKGQKGWRYVLCSPLTEEQRESLAKWKNIVISSCSHRYAPEITHDTVILLDKMIKVEG